MFLSSQQSNQVFFYGEDEAEAEEANGVGGVSPVCAEVELVLTKSQMYEVVENSDSGKVVGKGGSEARRQLCVCQGKSATEVVRILPTQLGDITLEFKAIALSDGAEEGRRKNGNKCPAHSKKPKKNYSDYLKKKLSVQAEGFEQVIRNFCPCYWYHDPERVILFMDPTF